MIRYAGVIILVCVCGVIAPTFGSGLWLDKSDIVIDVGGGCTLDFTIDGVPKDMGAILWLAGRVSFMIEERTVNTLEIKLNGTPLGPNRLIANRKVFRLPCDSQYPVRTKPKCTHAKGADLWTIRYDNNFVIGQTDIFSWRRQYATEWLEPSLAIDVSGLVRKGRNRLVLRDARKKSPPLPADLNFPPNPKVPWYSVHCKFVRLGTLSAKRISSYNIAHTEPIDSQPRTFNVVDPKGLAEMERYYTAAPEKTERGARKAFLNFIHAKYQLWNGNYSKAESLLKRSLGDGPEKGHLAQTMFLLAVAQSRRGDQRAAGKTWNRLRKQFPASSWSDTALREATIVSWKGKSSPINWPHLEAVRTKQPPLIDGNPDEAAWAKAPVADGFSLHTSKYERAPVRTEVRALYDQRYLYFSVICHEPYMDEVVNPHHKRDSAVWYDDCIEFFLDPQRTYTQVFEFEIGVEGGIVDCLNVGHISFMQYDPPRIDKVIKHRDRWTVEIAIPFNELRTAVPAAGSVWLCNVVRNRPRSEHRQAGAYVLGPTTKRFADHKTLALLIFR